MRIYPPLYLEKLCKLCDEYNVLLIVMTGKMFAFDYTNVSPDIMTISKVCTGGLYANGDNYNYTKSMTVHADYNEAKRLCTAILIVVH